MKHFYYLILFCYAFCTANGQLISFQRGDYIWVKNQDNNTEQILCKGVDPDISPDGKKVAFTTYGLKGERKISIIDIKTQKITTLDSLPGDNNYGPKWSPSGKYILYNHYGEMKWCIQVVTPCGENEFDLSNNITKNVYSPTWYTDKYIVCHNLDTLFLINLENKYIYEKPLALIADNIGESSACEILLSNDSTKIVYTGSIANPLSNDIKLSDGPSTAIYILDIKDNIGKRITPTGIYAYKPQWIFNGDIIFTGFTAKDIHKSIGDYHPITRHVYRYFSKTGKFRKIINNASDASSVIINSK
ncbi:MAG: hypothetical protein Q7U71_10210 [bacterium]|nr:hypothetical protein [bacterium]